MIHRSQHLATSNTLNAEGFVASTANVLVVGLGGMGVIGLTQRIGAILRSRFGRVFTKENRGFAQRRASVTGTVRAGHRVRSPELVTGANLVLALEASEALRHEQMISPSAQVVVCDACVWPTGHAGKNFQPLDVAQVEAHLTWRGARVLSLPVCAWLKGQGLPQVYTSSAMLGAFAALSGIAIEQVENLLGDSWQDKDRDGNLAACCWAHSYVLSLKYLGRVAKAA